MPDIQSSPTATSGIDRKFTVPSSNAASSDSIWCQPPATLTPRMVPPENHGRRSRARASRRASRQPTPVGKPNTLYQLIATNSGLTTDRSSRLVGTNAAASSSTSYPAACARYHPGEGMPHAAEVGLRRVGEQPRPLPVTPADRGEQVGLGDPQLGAAQPDVSHAAPARAAYSLIPLTELWLSAVSTSLLRRPNGYASPTRRQAPVAFGVKMTAYSSAVALKYLSTAARVRSTSRVAADDVGFSECGFPYTRGPQPRSRARAAATGRPARRRCSRGTRARPRPGTSTRPRAARRAWTSPRTPDTPRGSHSSVSPRVASTLL